MNAIEIVMLTWRMLHFWRAAICSIVAVPATSSSSPARATLELECVQSIFENFIQVRQPVLDKPVKAFELLVGLRHFPVCCNAISLALRPFDF